MTDVLTSGVEALTLHSEASTPTKVEEKTETATNTDTTSSDSSAAADAAASTSSSSPSSHVTSSSTSTTSVDASTSTTAGTTTTTTTTSTSSSSSSTVIPVSSTTTSYLTPSPARADLVPAAQFDPTLGADKRGGYANDPETGYYDEIEIEDMEYDEDTRIYTYPCPCGDKFRISRDDLLDGEEIARCPSCSLVIKVIYDPEELAEEDEDD